MTPAHRQREAYVTIFNPNGCELPADLSVHLSPLHAGHFLFSDGEEVVFPSKTARQYTHSLWNHFRIPEEVYVTTNNILPHGQDFQAYSLPQFGRWDSSGGRTPDRRAQK